MKTLKPFLLLPILAILIIAGIYVFWTKDAGPVQDEPSDTVSEEGYSEVASFVGCVEAGLPVMESYPRQCATPDGRSFTEDIGNVLEKSNLITVTTVNPNDTVSSPLTVSGEARGYWYFEASFPVRLFDGNNNEIAVAPATALSDWMTEDFVPFSVTLTFAPPSTPTGTLRLERDNPSGLPENDDALIIPVVF